MFFDILYKTNINRDFLYLNCTKYEFKYLRRRDEIVLQQLDH